MPEQKEFNLIGRASGVGTWIHVIKALRAATDMPLKEAKLMVDLACEYYELDHDETNESGFSFTEFVLTCQALRKLVSQTDEATIPIVLALRALESGVPLITQAVADDLDFQITHSLQVVNLAHNLLGDLSKEY